MPVYLLDDLAVHGVEERFIAGGYLGDQLVSHDDGGLLRCRIEQAPIWHERGVVAVAGGGEFGRAILFVGSHFGACYSGLPRCVGTCPLPVIAAPLRHGVIGCRWPYMAS